MKKVRIRCDYCGIEHRGTIENDTLKIERYSAMVYEDETEDVQSLNDSSDTKRDAEDKGSSN